MSTELLTEEPFELDADSKEAVKSTAGHPGSHSRLKSFWLRFFVITFVSSVGVGILDATTGKSNVWKSNEMSVIDDESFGYGCTLSVTREECLANEDKCSWFGEPAGKNNGGCHKVRWCEFMRTR